MITLIVAVGQNLEIGADNKLLWNIPEEMKVFKEYTNGKTVLMGRKTFESIGRPLPNRKNLVLSETMSTMPGVTVCRSIEEAMTIEEDIVVIGGAFVYTQSLPYVDQIIISFVNGTYPHADTFFPEFREDFIEIETLVEHDQFVTKRYIRK